MNNFIRNFVYSFIFVLLMWGVTNAQDKNNKLRINYNEQISGNSFTERKVYCDKLCVGSIATYGTGFFLDANSSWNKLEKNKIFIGNNGKFSFSKYSLYHSGLIGITFITQKKYPLASSIVRFGIGGWLIYAASKNYRYSPDQTIRCCVLKLGDGTNGRP